MRAAQSSRSSARRSGSPGDARHSRSSAASAASPYRSPDQADAVRCAAASACCTASAMRSAKAASRTSMAGAGGPGWIRLRTVASTLPIPSARKRATCPAPMNSCHCRSTSARMKVPRPSSSASAVRADAYARSAEARSSAMACCSSSASAAIASTASGIPRSAPARARCATSRALFVRGDEPIQRLADRPDRALAERVARRVEVALRHRDELQLAARGLVDQSLALEERAVVGQDRIGVGRIGRQAVDDGEQRHPAGARTRQDVPRHLVGIAAGGRHEDDEIGELEQLHRALAVLGLDTVEVGRIHEHQAAPRPVAGS